MDADARKPDAAESRRVTIEEMQAQGSGRVRDVVTVYPWTQFARWWRLRKANRV